MGLRFRAPCSIQFRRLRTDTALVRDAGVTDVVRTTEGLALMGSTDETVGAPDPQNVLPHRYSIDGLRALARAVRELEETG